VRQNVSVPADHVTVAWTGDLYPFDSDCLTKPTRKHVLLHAQIQNRNAGTTLLLGAIGTSSLRVCHWEFWLVSVQVFNLMTNCSSGRGKSPSAILC